MLKEEYEGKDGYSTAALLREVLKPRARWEKMCSEGRDLGDTLASLKKVVAQYRIAACADLQQAVQEAVMEHASAAYRDLLKEVPLANRESFQALRAYVREWTLAQRTYDDLGRHTALDVSADGHWASQRDEGKGQERGKARGKKGNGEAKCNAWTDDSYFAGECGYCGKWGHKNAQFR